MRGDRIVPSTRRKPFNPSPFTRLKKISRQAHWNLVENVRGKSHWQEMAITIAENIANGKANTGEKIPDTEDAIQKGLVDKFNLKTALILLTQLEILKETNDHLIIADLPPEILSAIIEYLYDMDLKPLNPSDLELKSPTDSSEIPLGTQFQETIQTSINSGQVKPGRHMPPPQTLRDYFVINLKQKECSGIDFHQIYRQLVEDGFLIVIPKIGHFIKGPSKARKPEDPNGQPESKAMTPTLRLLELVDLTDRFLDDFFSRNNNPSVLLECLKRAAKRQGKNLEWPIESSHEVKEIND